MQDKPRTSEPVNEWGEKLERFAKPADEYIESGKLPACPNCDSERGDGWMSEGGTDYAISCADCDTVYNEEGETIRQVGVVTTQTHR